MKLPLQLVVVVLYAQRNFCDTLLKFTLHGRVNLTKLTTITTTTNCRVSFIDLYLVFLENLRIVFFPHANTVILPELYRSTITESLGYLLSHLLLVNNRS